MRSLLASALAVGLVWPCLGQDKGSPALTPFAVLPWVSCQDGRVAGNGPLLRKRGSGPVMQQGLERTEAVPLEGLYEDPAQQAIPFGRRSFYLAPWRAYMDTWPAQRFLDCLGIVFNVNAKAAEATAQALADAGFTSVRVELGWGSFSYEDPFRLVNPGPFRSTLASLQRAGLRPLVLLNANSQIPVPTRYLQVELREPAAVGSRELFLVPSAGAREIRPGYAGLSGQDAVRLGFPLVVSFDPTDGRCGLSAPLIKALPAGHLFMPLLRYHPFGGRSLADGTLNPYAQETLEGWRQYVAAVVQLVQDCLGTRGAPDAGFDLEVWNELGFGSAFLDEKNYYSPPRAFRDRLRYAAHGREILGAEAILPVTVDYVADPSHDLRGVKVVSGFSNQRPWEDGEGLWPGEAGFSRHFYTELRPGAPFAGYSGFLSRESDNRPGSGPVNALGGVDGIPDGRDWYTVRAGSFFVPQVAVSMPEVFHFGYKEEFLTRDVQPFPSLMKGHYRYSHPGDGRAAEVWMTETNSPRWPWIKGLLTQTGADRRDPRVIALCDFVAAKSLLRTMVFQSHKGVRRIDIYAAQAGDATYGVIPDAFFEALARNGGAISPETQALHGRSLEVMGRVSRLFRHSEPLTVTRALRVESLAEREPRLVFAGDGSPEHPSRFNRDDFACLPFQLAANRYAIGYYVVTQNMVAAHCPERDVLDPGRYSMPEQGFELTLRNVRGQGARVAVYDPMTDETYPAQVLASGVDRLKVLIPTVDYPRFLLVGEAEPGPLIESPALERQPDGSVRLSFGTNVPACPRVTWGSFPSRAGVGRIVLPSGKRFEVQLPAWSSKQGLQIRLERDGLVTEWPRWAYDTAGVLWPVPRSDFARRQ